MKLRLVLASLVSVSLLTASIVACRDTPGIDGASIPKIGSAEAPPTCAQVCDRLAALCGYAPDECATRCAEEDDEGVRLCRGQASSCQAALADCVPAATDGGEPDSGEPDSGEPDAAPSPEDAAPPDGAAVDASDAGG